jgi:hypothetical protein
VLIIVALLIVSGDDDGNGGSTSARPSAASTAGDVRQENLGSFQPGESIPVTLEEGDISFLLTAVGEDRNETLTVTTVTDPDGEAIYEVTPDLISATGGLTQASRGGYEPGEASIIAPVHPGLDVRPGTYEILIDHVVPVEATVMIKSGDVSPDARQAVDLNVWLLSSDHDQAKLEEELKVGMDAVLEPQNLEIGDISFTVAGADDLDSFSSVDADSPLSEVCLAMREDLGLERAVNLAIIESFLDDSTIGLASGLPGAPQMPIAGADCVVASTQIEGEVLPITSIASTVVHEGSHFMGLSHTTEEDGTTFDDFADTADCDIATFDGRENFDYPGEVDELISATECGVEGAADNYMFFEDSPDDTRDVLTQTAMTPDQAWALRRHPLFYPVDGGDGPTPPDDDTVSTAPDEDAGTAGDEPPDGASAGGVPDPEPAAGLADYGTDPELDALADDCEAGAFDACDDLFRLSPIASAYEDYGASCGGRGETTELCTDVYGGG